MTIDEVAAKATGAEKRGKKYKAECPLHKGEGKLLTISREFGSILLECRKMCPDHEVARALGLSMADLFDDDDDSITGGYIPEDEDKPVEGDAPNEDTAPDEILTGPKGYDFNGDEIPTNAFKAMRAKSWLKESSERPVPRQLFGPFWLEDEVSILFADTGKGKSVLAVQIAEALASGHAIAPFDLDIDGEKVLYFDFELSEKMFESRYSVPAEVFGGRATRPYPFHDNFIRAQLSGSPDFPAYYEDWNEFLYHSTDELFRETGARLVIIDNITYLGTRSKEQSGGAIYVMRVLHQLRKLYGLSILVIAHTPKRLFRSGITANDLQGSKMLSNFADNVFAIGESCLGADVRYLKHIKPRNSPLVHGAENVCSYLLEKPSNFLRFTFTGFSHEREHIENISLSNDSNRKILARSVRDLAALGHTQREIATHLNISVATVNRYLKN